MGECAPGADPNWLTDAIAGEGRWLTVMAATTLAELVWWAIAWSAGIAPAPLLPIYLLFALAALAGASALHLLIRRRGQRASWPVVAAATVLVALGASLFLPLKFAIPSEIPFWLDQPLAAAERALVGTDPWLLLDRLLGWAAIPVDRIYALWLPVQSLALFALILQPPSAGKSRALTAYALAWFLLGAVAAALLSSAGPLFYGRLFGGGDFAALRPTLLARGATMVVAESDRMYASLSSGNPGLVAGISAVPSLHVAVSLWMALAARSLAPRAAPVAFAYFAFIWIASVQLGWHYVADGLAGALGMLALWWLAGAIERRWAAG